MYTISHRLHERLYKTHMYRPRLAVGHRYLVVYTVYPSGENVLRYVELTGVTDCTLLIRSMTTGNIDTVSSSTVILVPTC